MLHPVRTERSFLSSPLPLRISRKFRGCTFDNNVVKTIEYSLNWCFLQLGLHCRRVPYWRKNKNKSSSDFKRSVSKLGRSGLGTWELRHKVLWHPAAAHSLAAAYSSFSALEGYLKRRVDSCEILSQHASSGMPTSEEPEGFLCSSDEDITPATATEAPRNTSFHARREPPPLKKTAVLCLFYSALAVTAATGVALFVLLSLWSV